MIKVKPDLPDEASMKDPDILSYNIQLNGIPAGMIICLTETRNIDSAEIVKQVLQAGFECLIGEILA